MKKHLVIGIVIILLVVGLSGCLEQKEEECSLYGTWKGKTELGDDFIYTYFEPPDEFQPGLIEIVMPDIGQVLSGMYVMDNDTIISNVTNPGGEYIYLEIRYELPDCDTLKWISTDTGQIVILKRVSS